MMLLMLLLLPLVFQSTHPYRARRSDDPQEDGRGGSFNPRTHIGRDYRVASRDGGDDPVSIHAPI